MHAEDTADPRVVIDTNVLLDWCVFRQPAALALVGAVQAREWSWIVTPAMVEELRCVLARPLAERWQAAQKLALTIDVDAIARMCTPPAAFAAKLVCRDPNDQMFIDLALARSPCWLITRDRALLALRRRAVPHGVAIATPEFWHREHVAATAGTPAAPA
jgi:putative PIN family toxin of toxin-antitoxin system